MYLAQTGASSFPLGSELADGIVPFVMPQNQLDPPTEPTAYCEEPLEEFVIWLAAQLGLHATPSDTGLRAEIPEEERGRWGGREQLELRIVGNQVLAHEDDSSQLVAEEHLSSPFAWMLEQIRQRGPAAQAETKRRPATHSVAAKLFPSYEIEGGQAHLAGCQFEDRAFVRLSYLSDSWQAGIVRHWFIAADGSSVPSALVTALGLDDTIPVPSAPVRIPEKQLQRLVRSCRHMVALDRGLQRPASNDEEPLLVALVWAKHVSGQLQFTIGSSTTQHSFGGWAATVNAPPFRCPVSGKSTFHLAAVDDGRIVAAEEIGTCAYSHRRVPLAELVRCPATHSDVLKEFTEICPVLNRPVLRDRFARCQSCRQRVSTAALESNVCAACRCLRPVAKDDPRLVWLCEEHAGLSRWRWWRLAETREHYIARAAGIVRRILIVCDCQSLEIRHLAIGNRGSATWKTVEPQQWDTVLRLQS